VCAGNEPAQAIMDTVSRTLLPNDVSPTSVTRGRASSLLSPLVNTCQETSWSTMTWACGIRRALSYNSQLSPSRSRDHRPPAGPEMVNATRVPSTAWMSLKVCGGGTDKGVEHRREETRFLQPFPADRVPDVLLMVPPLCVLAGQVEPDWGGVGAGPADGVAHGIGIERFKVGNDLRSCQLQEVYKKARADPPGRLDPRLVPLVDEGDQLIPAVTRELDGVSVAPTGEHHDIVTQQMQRDILHRPRGAGRRAVPIVGGEPRKQIDEGRQNPWEAIDDYDGLWLLQQWLCHR